MQDNDKPLVEGQFKFNLDHPLAKQEMELYLKSSDYQSALSDIHNNIFRPARKHGYNDRKINKILDEIAKNTEEDYNGEELIGELEELFFKILEDYNIELL